MQYDIIVDFRGFKWLIQTTDHSPVGARIGVKIDPDGFHIMKKSQYSGMFGDYSSYSDEYDELSDVEALDEEDEGAEEERRRKAMRISGSRPPMWAGWRCSWWPLSSWCWCTPSPGRRPTELVCDGGELRRHGGLRRRVRPVLPAGGHRHRGVHPAGLSHGLLPRPGAGQAPEHGHHAHHAAHVDELPAADLLLDVPAGAQRPCQQDPGLPGVLPPAQRPRRGAERGVRPLPAHECILRRVSGHFRRGGAGHGLQLPALHGAAHLLGHHQDRQPGHRGGPGPGGRQRAGVPAG